MAPDCEPDSRISMATAQTLDCQSRGMRVHDGSNLLLLFSGSCDLLVLAPYPLEISMGPDFVHCSDKIRAIQAMKLQECGRRCQQQAGMVMVATKSICLTLIDNILTTSAPQL